MKTGIIACVIFLGILMPPHPDVAGTYKHVPALSIYYLKLNTDSTVEFAQMQCRGNTEKTGKWYFNKDTLVLHYTKFLHRDNSMIEKYFVYGDTLKSPYGGDYFYVRK